MIITIGREYGSGGHAIGQKLAEKLGINFYDKNLIALTAQKSGLCEDVLKESDERAPGLIMTPYTGSVADQLYNAQISVIKSLADSEDCVIVGRCANYILAEYAKTLDVFIYAPSEDRVKRIAKDYLLVSEDAARKEMKKIDKARRSYYQFYSDYQWGQREGIDLMINSSLYGIDGTADVLADLAKKYFA